MTIKKKKYPLVVLQHLEKFIKKRLKHCIRIESGTDLIRFIDSDPNSDFFYNIENFNHTAGQLRYIILMKPASAHNVSQISYSVEPNKLEENFNKWYEMLSGYESVQSIFDDPIIEYYSKEFFSEFRLVDEDADYNPFNSKVVLQLDQYLSNIDFRIEEFCNDNNENEIKHIRSDISELRQNLTRDSKNLVLEKIYKIWAQIAKQGPVLLKEFIDEGKRMAFQEIIKLIVSSGTNLIN